MVTVSFIVEMYGEQYTWFPGFGHAAIDAGALLIDDL